VQAAAPTAFQAAPSADLATVVSCFWELRLDTHAAQDQALIVPDGSHELVVEMGRFAPRLDAQGRALGSAAAVMAGQLTRAFELATPPGYHAFGIRLHAWGAAALVGDDVPALTDATVALADVYGTAGTTLAELLTLATSFAQRVQLAQVWLRRQLKPAQLNARLPLACRGLGQGRQSVAQVAAWLQLSTRQLERLFLRNVGVAPKVFARQQRFARATAALARARSLAELAADCGYADQAHMARDFRAFAGLAPSGLGARLDAVAAVLSGIGARDVAFVQAPLHASL
jgi:AraC-like DNA-binding protein